MSPRLVTPEDLPGLDTWTCWYDGWWGFIGDQQGKVCDGCGNVMCEECASVHQCLWIEEMLQEYGWALRELVALHDGDMAAAMADLLERWRAVAPEEVP